MRSSSAPVLTLTFNRIGHGRHSERRIYLAVHDQPDAPHRLDDKQHRNIEQRWSVFEFISNKFHHAKWFLQTAGAINKIGFENITLVFRTEMVKSLGCIVFSF